MKLQSNSTFITLLLYTGTQAKSFVAIIHLSYSTSIHTHISLQCPTWTYAITTPKSVLQTTPSEISYFILYNILNMYNSGLYLPNNSWKFDISNYQKIAFFFLFSWKKSRSSWEDCHFLSIIPIILFQSFQF